MRNFSKRSRNLTALSSMGLIAVGAVGPCASTAAEQLDHPHYGNVVRQVIEKEHAFPGSIQAHVFCYLRSQGLKGFKTDKHFVWIVCDDGDGWDVGSTPTFLDDWAQDKLMPPNWTYRFCENEQGIIGTFERDGSAHQFTTPPLPTRGQAKLWGLTAAIDTEWHFRHEKEWRTPYHLEILGDPT